MWVRLFGLFVMLLGAGLCYWGVSTASSVWSEGPWLFPLLNGTAALSALFMGLLLGLLFLLNGLGFLLHSNNS